MNQSERESLERAMKRAYGIPARERRRRWLRIYLFAVLLLAAVAALMFILAYRP